LLLNVLLLIFTLLFLFLLFLFLLAFALEGILEVADARSKTSRKLGYLPAPEDQEQDDEDQYQFSDTYWAHGDFTSTTS
jgi:hypothetical protein